MNTKSLKKILLIPAILLAVFLLPQWVYAHTLFIAMDANTETEQEAQIGHYPHADGRLHRLTEIPWRLDLQHPDGTEEDDTWSLWGSTASLIIGGVLLFGAGFLFGSANIESRPVGFKREQHEKRKLSFKGSDPL